VKIFKNVLDSETMNNVINDFKSCLDQNIWRNSQLCWDKRLVNKVTGDCSITPIKDNIASQIKKCVADKLPSAEKIQFQYQIWKQNSGTSLHNDQGYKYAATIYLNASWHVDDGGIFMWKEGDELKAFCPECNTMVLNDEKTLHLVTIVSPLATEFRCTIQIWGI